MTGQMQPGGEGGSVPTPDPTKLTTDAVKEAVEVARREIAAAIATLTQRIDGIEAVEQEKLNRINERFALVEALRQEQKADVRTAVEAALAAQKEAVDKSDEALQEHIDQQVQQIRAALLAADELERERMEQVKAMIHGVQRELSQAMNAAAVAVQKAETANDQRIAALQQVAEAQIQEMRRQVADLTAKMGKLA